MLFLLLKIKSLLLCSVYITLFLSHVNMSQSKGALISSEERNLQYSMKSIYYDLVYPSNDLTGTGDKLKDVPYKVLCKIIACTTGCCVGEIDNMRCGAANDCKTYKDYSNMGGVIAAIVVPISVTIILVFLTLLFNKKWKYTCCTSFVMALGCIFIIPLPFIIYCICKKDCSVTAEKNKEK